MEGGMGARRPQRRAESHQDETPHTQGWYTTAAIHMGIFLINQFLKTHHPKGLT